jgi:hypothetical protein
MAVVEEFSHDRADKHGASGCHERPLPPYSLESISNRGADSDGPALIKYWGAHLPLFSVISTADR